MSNVNEQMTALADAIRAKSGQTGKMTIEKMTIAVEGLVVTDDDIRLQDKVISENGTYTADDGYHGFGEVTVAVENEPIVPDLQEKTITENGTYTPDDGYDGFEKVTVNVPSISAKTLGVTIRNNTGKPLSVVYYVKSEGKIEMRQTTVSGQSALACVDGTHLSLIADGCALSLDNYAGNLLLIDNTGNRADFLVKDQGESYATVDASNGGALGTSIEFTENGTYTAEGLYGYRNVIVNVPEKEAETLKTVRVSVYNNTTGWMYIDYKSLDGEDAISNHIEIEAGRSVAIDCVGGSMIFIQVDCQVSLDYYDGSYITNVYNRGDLACFEVRVPENDGATDSIDIGNGASLSDSLYVTKNGTYTADSMYGYSPVVVAVDNTGGTVETCRVHIRFEDGGHTGANIHYTGIDDNSGAVSDFVINNVGVNPGDTYEFYAVKGSILLFEGLAHFSFYNGEELWDAKIVSARDYDNKYCCAVKVTRDLDMLPE